MVSENIENRLDPEHQKVRRPSELEKELEKPRLEDLKKLGWKDLKVKHFIPGSGMPGTELMQDIGVATFLDSMILYLGELGGNEQEMDIYRRGIGRPWRGSVSGAMMLYHATSLGISMGLLVGAPHIDPAVVIQYLQYLFD